jgi:hypothetical protein
MSAVWTSDWPTEEGFHIFYGRKSDLVEDSALYFVNVFKTKYGFIYISKGQLLEKSNGAVGVWMR